MLIAPREVIKTLDRGGQGLLGVLDVWGCAERGTDGIKVTKCEVLSISIEKMGNKKDGRVLIRRISEKITDFKGVVATLRERDAAFIKPLLKAEKIRCLAWCDEDRSLLGFTDLFKIKIAITAETNLSSSVAPSITGVATATGTIKQNMQDKTQGAASKDIRIAVSKLFKRLTSTTPPPVPRCRRLEEDFKKDQIEVFFSPKNITTQQPQQHHEIVIDDSINTSELTQVLAEEELSTEEAEQPKTVVTQLHPHQKRALHWMASREEGTEVAESFKNLILWDTYTLPYRVGYHQINGKLVEAKMWANNPTNRVWVNQWSGEVLNIEPPKPPPAKGGVLADEMGLGKTLTMLALLSKTFKTNTREASLKRKRSVSVDSDKTNVSISSDRTFIDVDGGSSSDPFEDLDDAPPTKWGLPSSSDSQEERTLIVAPVSLLTHWADEATRHLSKNCARVHHYHGNKRGKSSEELKRYNIVLTSYTVVGLEWQKIAKMGNKIDPNRFSAGTLPEEKSALLPQKTIPPLFGVHWDRIILDEAHTIREATTQWSQGCTALRGTKRWCVTGTPVQNKLDDLWSLLRFLKIPVLSEHVLWTKLIGRPLEAGADTVKGVTPDDDVEISDFSDTTAAIERIKSMLRVLVLRREKKNISDVGLPPKTETVVRLDFTDDERPFYEVLSKLMQDKFNGWLKTGELGKKRANVLEMLLRLRQATDHPYLVINGISRMQGLMSDTAYLAAFVTSLKTDADGDDYRLKLARKIEGLGSTTEAVQTLSESKTCPACQDTVDLNDPSLLPCGHSYCYDCARQTVTLTGRCKTCAAPATVHQLIRPLGPENLRHVDPGKNWKPSSKVVRLLKDLKALGRGNKAVVFSQFTSMLDIVEIALTREKIGHSRLDGSMDVRKRDKSVEMLRTDPQCVCILVSLKAGGVGLNLSAANTVILLDPWWNPASEAQAMDRVHRVGQTKPVTALRYIISDTVEERLLMVQHRKKSLSDGLLGDFSITQNKLTLDDLKTLFGFDQ
eukprot:TRINITY_DN30823_c0_g1_i1.p1 TRINITY_DN30823_c0_g1~~TRINITY_DN30823_c0_g1_i1.p1  ORF type:complete len:1034 (+),score=274.86 TRINITY_DN30823_c0_g1_i1:68-3103(+)